MNLIAVFVNNFNIDRRELFNRHYDLTVGRIPFAVYIQQPCDIIFTASLLILIMPVSFGAIKVVYVEYCAIGITYCVLFYHIFGKCITVNNMGLLVRIINGRLYVECHKILLCDISTVFFGNIHCCLVFPDEYISAVPKLLFVIFNYAFTERGEMLLISQNNSSVIIKIYRYNNTL